MRFLLASILSVLLISYASADCTPSVTSSQVSANSTLFVVVGCGFSSLPFSFNVGSRLETVAFNATTLFGPMLVSKGDTSIPFNAPQGTGVFGQGSYPVTLRNFGSSTDAWFINVTVSESLYGPYTTGENSEPGNNAPQRAERLSVNGRTKRGEIFPTFDVDWYTFSLDEPQQLQLLGNTIFGENTFVGALFSIFNQQGVAMNTPILSSSPFLQQRYALQPGKYYISVKADVPLTTPVIYDISLAFSRKSCALDLNACFA